MRPTLELPRLSLTERDRRWVAVRKEMAARNLDVIVLWGWPTMWDFYTANARYLCPIGGTEALQRRTHRTQPDSRPRHHTQARQLDHPRRLPPARCGRGGCVARQLQL